MCGLCRRLIERNLIESQHCHSWGNQSSRLYISNVNVKNPIYICDVILRISVSHVVHPYKLKWHQKFCEYFKAIFFMIEGFNYDSLRSKKMKFIRQNQCLNYRYGASFLSALQTCRQSLQNNISNYF